MSLYVAAVFQILNVFLNKAKHLLQLKKSS